MTPQEHTPEKKATALRFVDTVHEDYRVEFVPPDSPEAVCGHADSGELYHCCKDEEARRSLRRAADKST